ncbi:hypothetical protein ACFPZ0_14650 [Streptomonospora nanhaiensis]|uniref:Uncharacterized protein n=1 Tax=Streptomonospora nanhaiensis TaxID=1323731 RepID=A0A853BPX7_9ACTN|nr:hypothetical protein [Streptomonospora nanhaiensis]MBV2367090.1 hypothetical protein [Streptomonospora nanhaiensis]MBX9389555.1 hypothetical protein [Streptomonospora nanhaiensis]NYI97729.1 hypothetical protein [Streptomonospora nanhaiensis]
MSDVDARSGGKGARRPWSVARRLREWQVGPTGMSQIGLLLAVAAAVWFTDSGVRGAVVGSLLLALVLCTDPVAERLRGDRPDRLELWLSLMLLRLREYVVYVGLAVGGALAGVPDAWAWAAGALIAQALQDSVAAARGARAGEPEWIPGPDGGTPLDAVDPSRDVADRSPSDPSLADELLGDPREPEPPAPADAPAGATAAGDPAATVPAPRAAPAPEGGADTADTEGTDGTEGPAGARLRTVPAGRPWPGWAHALCRSAAADTGSAAPAGARPGLRVPPPVRAVLAFPQIARFAVVALTITIWDARVTFIALIAGCALAIAVELVETTTPDTAR